MLEQLKMDFESLKDIEVELTEDLKKYNDLTTKIDNFVALKMDATSRTSQEKQIMALRATEESFNNDVLESNLLKNKIELLKNKLSIISTRQRLADTINRTTGLNNLIEG